MYKLKNMRSIAEGRLKSYTDNKKLFDIAHKSLEKQNAYHNDR